MLRTYFKIAWRNISRHKLFTLMNVLGLTVGICVCLAIHELTHFERSFDAFHPDKDLIYRMISESRDQQGDKRTNDEIPSAAPAAARKSVSGLQEVAHYIPYSARIIVPAGNGQPAKAFNNKATRWQVSSIVTDASYFNILRYDWLAGNAAGSMSRPAQLVLTESKAHLYFGATALDKMIGRQLIFNDTLRLTVSGIVKDWDANTDFPFTEFISMSTLKNNPSWGNAHQGSDSRALVKLTPGASPAKIGRQLTAMAAHSMTIDSGTTYTLQLQPLADIHFDHHVYDSGRKADFPTLYGLTAIALFILLIASINFINLSTAQSLQRAKEIGIRKVLGSSKATLIIQFMVETLILTFFALILALLLVRPVLAMFHSFLPDGIHFRLFSPSTLLFALFVLPGTAMLAGLYPAIVLSAYEPAAILKGGGLQKGGQKGYLRKALIVFQFTISLVFIIGTLVVRDQIDYMRNKDLGFVSHAVINIETDWSDSIRKVSVLAQKIKQLPGVDQVALQSFPPLTPIGTGLTIEYKGKTLIELPATVQVADEHFIPLYRMKLLAGRNFIHSDSVTELIINESCAKDLGFTDPADAIGQFLGVAGYHPITGVVADFHEKSLHEPIRPVVFFNMPQGENNIAVKLAAPPEQVEKVLTRIGRQWKTVYPGQPFAYSFLDESIAAMYEQDRQMATLLLTAMLLMIFLSCMGLLGLSLFSVTQRIREMGIRKVLGATRANIVVLLSKDFIILVLIAFAIAAPVAGYFAHQWLQNFAFRITTPWWLFGLAGLGTVLISLLTVSLHSFKAALANPVKSLKSE